MIIIPTVFFGSLHFTLSTCGGPLGTKPDGTQSGDTDASATSRAIRVPMLIGGIVFVLAQTLKSIGMIGSRPGSVISIASAGVALYMGYRTIVHRLGGDRQVVKGYIVSSLSAGAMSIVVNQYIMKRLKTEMSLCILWLAWNVIGEFVMGYWRLCVRRLNLEKCDTHVICFLSIQAGACVNINKRVPLLCLSQYSFIVAMNAISFVIEVLNRITVVRRDTAFDRCVRRMKDEDMTWKRSTLHRQVYIHNEMLQEIFELVFPIPLALALFCIQFNPIGVPVDPGPIATNCALQMLQEFCADGCAIWYGSTYQRKFYRVAASNMWNTYRFKLMTVLIFSATFCVSGFYLYTYLRVGETFEGKHITLI
jgi:hypothetical protein